MQLTFLAQVLWATGLCELVTLLLVLIVRRRWQNFPVFTAYITFQVVEAIALYGIHQWGSSSAYFWAYWVGVFLDLVLQLSVVFELTRIVLRPTGTWVRDAGKLFLLMAVAGALVAAAVSYAANPTMPNNLDNWIEKGSLFAAMLNAQLFVAMGLASTRLGLAWRHHVMGIATGWALWAFVGLFVEAAYSYLGASWHGLAFDQIRIVSYQAATIYWTVNLWLPEPQSRTLSPEMQSYLSALKQHATLGARGVSNLDRH
jgi:hypothetical protein